MPIATKGVCFSRLLKCLRILYVKQCGSRGAVCSGSTLFASILNSSVMLGNYLQQTTSTDKIFRCIFFLALKGLIAKLFKLNKDRKSNCFSLTTLMVNLIVYVACYIKSLLVKTCYTLGNSLKPLLIKGFILTYVYFNISRYQLTCTFIRVQGQIYRIMQDGKYSILHEHID